MAAEHVAKSVVRLLPFVALGLGAAWPPNALYAQSVLNATADSWLKQAAPAENHGSDAELSIKSKPSDNFRALLRFDLTSIPANANVTQADLRIRVTARDDSGLPTQIYRVTDSWSEGTVTWSNTGNDYDPGTVHGSFVPNNQGFMTIDLTALVQAWVCGQYGNHGLMLIPTSNDKESKYASREWSIAAQRPRLTVSTLGTTSCSGALFTITHNAFGINCVAETITVNVVDATAGTPLLNYNAQVELDTQSGFGTWALVAGSGAFSDGAAGDGIATYDWPLGESQATFTLYYPQGPPSIDVDVFQISDTGIRDNDAEGALVFSPNGFSVTAAALPNPPGAVTPFATNQTAGTNFAVHLAAYGQTPSDPVCGIIEAYAGAKNVKFWSQYVNPGTGTRNVTIDTIAIAATEAGAAAQGVTFTNGQAVVTAKYKDVGSIRIALKDDTTVNAELPAGITGATANFVVKPYEFVLSGIADAAGTIVNPQAADASGAVFVAAGAPFRATVTVRDAEGAATPNYGRETPAEGVRLGVQLHAPVGGANPAIGSTVGFGAFANGVATGTDFTWSEVGILRVLPGVGDADYLLAGDVTGSLSERIGRFIPSRFAVALNAPTLLTACGVGGFTYLGQSFGYGTAAEITATAVAAGGTTTTNYTNGAFFKLSNATLTGRTYTGASALDTSGLPAAGVDPAIVIAGPGIATLTFSSGAGLRFVKGAPQAPFDANVQLAVNVIDADGVAAVGAAPLGNPVTFGSAGGITFDAGQQIRYGRVRVGTAVGSERVDLPVPMRAEYYASDAAGFATNADDACTTNVSLAFSGYTENLNAGETCVRDSGAPGSSGAGCAAVTPLPLRYREPPVGGDFNLRLAAPGAGNQGSVVITAIVPDFLRFDWNLGLAGDENPSGQATFGIFGGESRQIYTREIY